MARRALLCAGFVFVYFYAFPYFERLHSANELPRVYLTEEIVDRGTFRLDARWGELVRGSTFDVATTPDGHRYSNKAPGASFLAVPAYLALKAWHRLVGGAPSLREATWAFRASVATVPALVFLIFFAGLARRFSPGEPGRRAGLLAYGLGSMALPYAVLFYSHQTAAVLVGGAFALAVAVARGETRRPRALALAAGTLAGTSVLVDYQTVIAALAVGVYLLVRAPRRLQVAVLAALGALPPALGLLLYHKACFGSPWKTGYSFAVDPAHHQGVLGVIGPNAAAFGQALVAPDNGLLVLMPWVVVALVGAVAVARDRESRARVGAEALVCGAVVVTYVLFIGSLVPEFGRAGWSVGPRYITACLPFLAWLAVAGFAALDRQPVLRALAHGLVAVGVVVCLVAATTYPHWPTAFKNPLYEVSFRALREGLAPHSLGTYFGLRGLPSLLPVYAVAAGLCVALLGGRRRWLSLAAAAAVAAVVVWSYGRFPRGAPEDKWTFIASEWEP